MQIDLQQFSAPCSCGKPHTISVKGIWIEPGALDRLPELIQKSGWAKPVIVCDDNTKPAAGSRAAELLPSSTMIYLPSKGLHADEHGVALAKEKLLESDVLIAVGSGTIHDLTRYIAHEKKLPFLSVPTAASVDGFVSTVAAMTWNGCKKTFPAVAPMYVLADSEIFSRAPQRLTISGVCDLLGKYTALADWRIGHAVTGEYFCQTVCNMEYAALEEVKSHLDEIQKGGQQACEALMYGLLLSGLAMQMVGNSRPASGAEHHLSHLWEMELVNPPIDAYHGEKVGVGLLLAARKYQSVMRYFESEVPTPKSWTGIELELIKAHAFGKKREGLLQENTPDPLAAIDLKTLNAKIPKILEILEDIPSEEQLSTMMESVGAKRNMSDIGLEQQLEEVSLRLSPYVRNRLTFMRLMKLWGLN